MDFVVISPLEGLVIECVPQKNIKITCNKTIETMRAITNHEATVS